MLNQQTLQKKLTSTHNIKHITEAIELVANVKLQKLLQKIKHFRFYANKLKAIVGNLTQTADDQNHPFFAERETKNVGVIIVTSDKGLCGSYNSNLLKEAERFLKQYSQEDVSLILFGKKSVNHFSKKNYKIIEKYENYKSKINAPTVNEWCSEFVKLFVEKKIDEMWIVYTHYKSILVREVRVEKILPMQKIAVSSVEKLNDSVETSSNYIFDPTPNEIYLKIIPYALATTFQSLVLESYAAELSARVVSMKAATTNAEEMITKLTLIKNKIRQFGITKEILEINAGAEGIL